MVGHYSILSSDQTFPQSLTLWIFEASEEQALSQNASQSPVDPDQIAYLQASELGALWYTKFQNFYNLSL